MANNVNIFDKYGIKEVANVYFEALDDDLKTGVYKGDIVLFLDTLKVSTIETTAENVAAQGGWGNPRLVQWDGLLPLSPAVIPKTAEKSCELLERLKAYVLKRNIV